MMHTMTNTNSITTDLEVGYNIPAEVGMNEQDIQTPCLVVDLDALERNIRKMGQFAQEINHRIRRSL